MGSASSRYKNSDGRREVNGSTTDSTPSTDSNCGNADTASTFQQPVLRRKSNLERRSTIPMELEDPEDFTVGESQAEYFPYASDTTDSTNLIDGDRQDVLSLIRERLLKLPKEVRNILAGGIAGIIAKSVVAPLDRIKIMYQVSSAEFHLLDIPKAARRIVQEEGFSALWKGNVATMIRIFPYSGIQFMVFDRLKHYFLMKQEHAVAIHALSENTSLDGDTVSRTKWGLTPMESLVSGMVAGTISVVCTYPLDLTRAQQAVLRKCPSHMNQGFFFVLTDNYRSRGVTGLFRGITPTLLGILPYSGIAFALNEQGKREIQHVMGREVTTMERIQCGAFAGLVAQTVTYPIEVTRRRMQTIGIVGIHNDSALSALESSVRKSHSQQIMKEPPSLICTVMDLYREQGSRGFMKGVSMNWMKGPVTFSISFTTFDYIQRWMESPKEREARRPPKFFGTATTSVDLTNR